jgi:hypothetical protein
MTRFNFWPLQSAEAENFHDRRERFQDYLEAMVSNSDSNRGRLQKEIVLEPLTSASRTMIEFQYTENLHQTTKDGYLIKCTILDI